MSEGDFPFPLPLLVLYFFEFFFTSIPSESCHKYVLQVCLSSSLSVAPGLLPSWLGWSDGVSVARVWDAQAGHHRERDQVLLICPFRLGEFSLHKLMWLGKVFWECCFVVGDLGA